MPARCAARTAAWPSSAPCPLYAGRAVCRRAARASTKVRALHALHCGKLVAAERCQCCSCRQATSGAAAPSVASLRSLFGSDRSPRGFRAAERLGVGSRVLKAWLRARVSPSPGCRTALRCRVWWVPWLRQDCPTTQGQGAVSRRAVAAATTYANSCAATCTRARACGRGVVVCAHWMRICAVRRNCI